MCFEFASPFRWEEYPPRRHQRQLASPPAVRDFLWGGGAESDSSVAQWQFDLNGEEHGLPKVAICIWYKHLLHVSIMMMGRME
jgi:hypothetical protein